MSRERTVLFVLLVLAVLLAVGGLSACAPKVVSEQDRAASTNFYRLAVSTFNEGNVIEALGALKEAENYNPEDPRIKNLYGLIFLGKRMLDDAQRSFEAAIRLDRSFSDAYLHLAIVHMERENWKRAIEILSIPANDIMYPRKDLALNNLGWCYHQLGQNDKAIHSLIMATSDNPKLCHGWYSLGRVYKSEGRFVEAMRALEHIPRIEECANFLLAYYELGIVAFRAKDFDRARTALARCVEMGGDRPEGLECRNYLNLIP